MLCQSTLKEINRHSKSIDHINKRIKKCDVQASELESFNTSTMKSLH